MFPYECFHTFLSSAQFYITSPLFQFVRITIFKHSYKTISFSKEFQCTSDKTGFNMVNSTNNSFKVMTNHTEGLKSEDFFHTKFEDLGEIESDEIIACCLINILIEIFGNGFLGLMIINQTSVIKPNEKTIINRLITFMCWNYMFNNIVNSPIITYGIIVNDIGE